MDFGNTLGNLNGVSYVTEFLGKKVPNDFSLGCLEQALDGGQVAELGAVTKLVHSGSVTAEDMMAACETFLHSGGRRTRGAHLTAGVLARWVASRLVPKRGAVLDPACGCGHLLVATARELGPGSPGRWYGWDIESEHVSATRMALWLAQGRNGRVSDFHNIRRADALLSSTSVEAVSVIANPPFMSIRRLTRECGSDYVAEIRRAIPTLRGNFDLFAAFLLRIPQWLAADGQFAVIVPAPFWSADYAVPVRALLAGYLTEVHDLGSRALFPDASVSLNVLVGSAEKQRRVRVFRVTSLSPMDPLEPALTVTASSLRDGFPISTPMAASNITLGDVATIHGGTPGYHAKAIGDSLLEENDAGSTAALPFVVSRNIDRYAINEHPVRFLRRRYDRPVIPLETLTAGKRALFRSSKILVPGVVKRFAAALDSEGVAMGVGVYAVVPTDIQPELVLALLNSETISSWYRAHFRGRELSGGYFGVNCNHLRAVPVAASWRDKGGSAAEIVELVRRRLALDNASRHEELDRRIDALVEQALCRAERSMSCPAAESSEPFLDDG